MKSLILSLSLITACAFGAGDGKPKIKDYPELSFKNNLFFLNENDNSIAYLNVCEKWKNKYECEVNKREP